MIKNDHKKIFSSQKKIKIRKMTDKSTIIFINGCAVTKKRYLVLSDYIYGLNDMYKKIEKYFYHSNLNMWSFPNETKNNLMAKLISLGYTVYEIPYKPIVRYSLINFKVVIWGEVPIDLVTFLHDCKGYDKKDDKYFIDLDQLELLESKLDEMNNILCLNRNKLHSLCHLIINRKDKSNNDIFQIHNDNIDNNYEKTDKLKKSLNQSIINDKKVKKINYNKTFY